jgi:hypothetical protein
MGRSGRYPSFLGTTRCYDFSPLILLRLGCTSARQYRSGVPTPDRKRRDLPGSWGASLLAFAALYDPGRAFVPSHEDDLRVRELLFSATFVCDCSLPVPRSVPRRCLAASRHVGARPRSSKRRGPQRCICFRGSITRPQRSLSTLRSTPHDVPRKTRSQRGASLCCTGFSPARLL